MPLSKKKKHLSDEEAVSLMKEGNKDAFSVLFHRYYQTVYLFCRGVIKDNSIAEDLSQEIFLKIWNSRDRLYCSSDGLRHFVFKVCRNHILDYLRKRFANSSPIETVPEDNVSIPSFEDEIYAKEMKTTLGDILESMPPQRRTVFELSREEQLSRKEIAAKMNISEATVKKHMELALKQIREGGNFKN